jgi:hypothetical protein
MCVKHTTVYSAIRTVEALVSGARDADDDVGDPPTRAQSLRTVEIEARRDLIEEMMDERKPDNGHYLMNSARDIRRRLQGVSFHRRQPQDHPPWPRLLRHPVQS